MDLLWPQGVKYENVIWFLTDAAPYTLKAGKILITFYPKMLHLTYVAHGLNHVAEILGLK